MTSARPRIGITSSVRGSQARRNAPYASAVAAAGGEPVWLEPDDMRRAANAASIVAEIDGLLLTGGVDIDPQHYGESLRPDAGITIDAERDAAELRITRDALAAKVPILGICRGIQTLNVAAGGSLHQDLGLLGLHATVHQQGQSGKEDWEPAHVVAAADRSRLSSLLSGMEIGVNSFHHQAVKAVAPGFVVTATAPDGVIEALENPALPFVVAVQWHPERMVDHHPRQRRLFEALIEAARARR